MQADVSDGLSEAAKEFSDKITSSFAPENRVFQFFSFDIKNSTAYKRAQKDWPLLVDKFYELTWNRLWKDDNRFTFWKHVGDEVLAFRRVRSPEDAWRATQHVHRVLHSVIDSLYKAFPKARQEQLSIKGASWLALCVELKNDSFSDAQNTFEKENFSDIVTRHSFETHQDTAAEQWDFLGPTIDSGFRITKHSGPGILVLSFELTYVLCRYLRNVTQAAEHRTFCRLVAYKSLPGIWRDRPYPIIWYAPQDGQSLAYFGYDDKINLAAEIQQYEDARSPNQPPLCDLLEGIAADVGILQYVKLIDQVLATPSPSEDETESSVLLRPKGASPEVHCVAICVNQEGKCLIAKRLPSRRVLPSTWEWGCATLLPHTDFFASMKQNYRAVFGIDIEFPTTQPLGTFFIAEKKVPGLLFAASVADATAAKNSGKHTQIKWVDETEAAHLASSESVVEGFVAMIHASMEAKKESETAVLD